MAGRTEGRAVGCGMLVDDLGPDRGVDGDGHILA